MIPDRALQLLSKDGFIRAYYDGIRAGQKCKNAFESANNEYFLFFGKAKYVDYRSFAASRDYSHKKFKKEAKAYLKNK